MHPNDYFCDQREASALSFRLKSLDLVNANLVLPICPTDPNFGHSLESKSENGQRTLVTRIAATGRLYYPQKSTVFWKGLTLVLDHRHVDKLMRPATLATSTDP